MRNLQIAHQNCTYMCQTPEQEAVARAFEIEMDLLGITKSETERSEGTTSFLMDMRRKLTERRTILAVAISSAGMIPILPQGGYFILANWSPLSTLSNTIFVIKQGNSFRGFNNCVFFVGEKIGAQTLAEYAKNLEPAFASCDDVTFMIWLAKQKQLLGVPPSAFYSLPNKTQAKDYIRFNFYKKLETLESAKDKLLRI